MSILTLPFREVAAHVPSQAFFRPFLSLSKSLWENLTTIPESYAIGFFLLGSNGLVLLRDRKGEREGDLLLPRQRSLHPRVGRREGWRAQRIIVMLGKGGQRKKALAKQMEGKGGSMGRL